MKITCEDCILKSVDPNVNFRWLDTRLEGEILICHQVVNK